MGKVIKTYLVDDTSFSMCTIEIWGWSGIVLTTFRNNLSDFQRERSYLILVSIF